MLPPIHTTLRPLSVTALLLLLPSWAAAQGADECALAQDLGSMLGSVAFDTAMTVDTGVAATTSPESACDLADDVWFRWTAPMALDRHIIRFDDCGSANFDTELGLYEGPACAGSTLIACVDDGCAGLTSEIEHVVQGGSTYWIQIGYWSPAGGTHGQGTLSLSDLGPEPCDLASDDALEDNDDCPGAYVGLQAGNHQDFFVSDTDPDAFAFDVAAGQTLSMFWSTGFGNFFDVDANLYDAGCGLIRNVDGSNLRFSAGSTAQRVVVEFYVDPLSQRPCGEYDVFVSFFADPCAGIADDGLEENDDCATALPRPAGLDSDLFVHKNDSDFYTVDVDAGSTLSVELFFQHQSADVDVFLYASEADCAAAPPGSSAGSLAAGFSSDDDESLVYTNPSGSLETYHLRVEVFPDGIGECNTYSMRIDGVAGGIGMPYCNANSNSAGTLALMQATGSTRVADQDFELATEGGVPGAPGLYFYGSTAIQVPFGDGFRCIGGATTRIQPPAQADVAGRSTRSLDFGAPYATGLVPGANLNFQLWYRDPMAGMAGFNLSNGLNTTFR